MTAADTIGKEAKCSCNNSQRTAKMQDYMVQRAKIRGSQESSVKYMKNGGNGHGKRKEDSLVGEQIMELDGKITKVIAKLDVLLDPKAALLNGLLDMEKRQSGKNKKGGRKNEQR